MDFRRAPSECISLLLQEGANLGVIIGVMREYEGSIDFM